MAVFLDFKGRTAILQGKPQTGLEPATPSLRVKGDSFIYRLF